MKSLRYRLLGQAVTLEDCLHRARRVRPRAVRIERRLEQTVHELGVLNQWVAVCEWDFPDRPVRFARVCGCARDNVDLVGASRLAERRLRKDLARIARLGLTVLGIASGEPAAAQWK